ncbi:MAG TPA: aminomethyl-transferring glycine dehydrogenase subunit GcvPA [Actinomycetota bacterium]|nr:aminomethyl-transferring glycine dehydrogenase subunit GcvPA [Actinomycetota bacterium]
MRFAPHTDEDTREMLAACGLSSVEDLFAHVPPAVRLGRDLDLPPALSEPDLLADLRALAGRNRHADDFVCFAGGGAYDHYVPAVVWALAGRSEFATSYTPYQPELSQGVLQALFEYQSMVCDLTGLEVSNASLYDGPTALVEAVRMACAATGRRRVLVSGTLDPRYLEVLRTYAAGGAFEPVSVPVEEGVTAVPEVGEEVAALVLQHPNFFGNLEPAAERFALAARAGARAVQVFDPLSLGVLTSPGELGADIAVAEGQPLGNHLSYGGPYLGVLAARARDVRRMPGRIVGETVDVEGRRGYVLTLQAREQHIRRERATSNICTNQTLMAVAAAVYLAWLGPEGLAEVGRLCLAKARYAAERLTEVGAVELAWPGAPFFKEFAVVTEAEPRAVRDALLERGFLVGPPVELPDGRRGLLVSVTERRTRDEVDRLVKAFEEVAAAGGKGSRAGRGRGGRRAGGRGR